MLICWVNFWLLWVLCTIIMFKYQNLKAAEAQKKRELIDDDETDKKLLSEGERNG